MINVIEKCHERKKDLVYDRMKEKLFLYLKNNIPLQSIELDQIQYYDFVKSNKNVFIMKFIADNKIKKVYIINDWFDKIAANKDNQATIILFIENQIKSIEKMEFKKSFLKYANKVTDVNVPMDFLVIMDKRKQEIMTKLKFVKQIMKKTFLILFTTIN